MQYILLALIASLVIFTILGCAAARQSTDEQNPDQPTIKPDEPAQPAASLLTSGKNILQQGINENNLDAMYAARATFERALADKIYRHGAITTSPSPTTASPTIS